MSSVDVEFGPLGTPGADQLVIAPLLVVLVTAVVTLAARPYPDARRVISVVGGFAYAASVAALAWHVVFAPSAAGTATYQVGGWETPYGIALVADGLSTFMLSMVAVVAVASLVSSARYAPNYDRRTFYIPLYHFLLLGVTGSFLAGDLFNLFVWFEVLLMASYTFVAFYGEAEHTRAAFWYVALNLVASAVFLLAIGGLYATAGTLNMAELARRIAEPAAYGIDPTPTVGLLGLLLSVFALKAGLVPFQFWIPAAYAAAPPPVTALLAGASKKVGIYAIIRISFTVFGGSQLAVSVPGTSLAGESPVAFVGIALFAMAVASILLGGLGAIERDSMEGVLAYSSIGQIGFIAIPVAIAAVWPDLRHLAILAALVYALNHAVAKGLLFLVVGAVRDATGTSHFVDLSGLAGRAPVLAGSFFVGALALVGIPPLSGFFGKFLAFDVAVRVGETAPAAAVSLVVVLLLGSLLTIAYTTRTWNRGFWGGRTDSVEGARTDPVLIGVVVALAVVVLAIGLGFEPVHRFADAAAESALDWEGYVDAVGGESTRVAVPGGDPTADAATLWGDRP
ncbi:complex I subunit 5 family protein [Halovivax limisalsi]|uniref:complex I subunit 5 family protein n=1 Tax=Halovivax limisalsi TaxID=1453760 RepID=UPI001FFC9950|nr:proton-conducting transporter membrane subunit [Halovivax limisalsi]